MIRITEEGIHLYCLIIILRSNYENICNFVLRFVQNSSYPKLKFDFPAVVWKLI
ncbi:hypothetical protein C0J52_07498 [Blattella germanica]|nr:hypothetical protein C0J52_07498 [Blattella germanica]